MRVPTSVRLSVAVAALALLPAPPPDATAHGPARETLGVAVGVPIFPPAAASSAPALGGRFDQVGHHALGRRALNSGLAVGARHAYVGNEGGRPIAILSIRRPDRPRVAGRLRQPAGETPEELRLWPRRDVLAVMTLGCRQPTCPQGVAPRWAIRLYDVRGRRARSPRLLVTHRLATEPHEIFLWQDPRRPRRALLYVSTPARSGENLVVLDISAARHGRVREVGHWTLPPEAAPLMPVGLHSMGLSRDGRRAYLAAFGLGLMVADTSRLADGHAEPEIPTLTPVENRATWPVGNAHSAVTMPGTSRHVVVADEIYGCPWGWIHVVDVRDPRVPRVAAEARVPGLVDAAHCPSPLEASYSVHNPTLTRHLMVASWYGAGLQAFTLRSPTTPRRIAAFRPEPLPRVAFEEPGLTAGSEKVITTTYPILRNGLIYVGDRRNGLYVLRYRGPYAREVRCAQLVEGNSSLARSATTRC